MGYFLKNRVTPSGSTGIVIPTGSTASRTAAPTDGYMRYNTDTNLMEFWNGAWTPFATSGGIVYTLTSNIGDGTTTSFSGLPTPGVANTQIQVFVNGLYQIPTTNYGVVGNAVVFTSAPPLNAPINVISTSD